MKGSAAPERLGVASQRGKARDGRQDGQGVIADEPRRGRKVIAVGGAPSTST